MAEVMTVKIDAEDVMERLMDDCLIEGKSLRQWIKSIVDHKWIPCSECMPTEKDGNVLVTTFNGELKIGKHSEYSETWCVGDMCADYVEDYVLAWMPLPEPYKAGDGSE